MPNLVVLLRAVNVGRHGRVTMADVRAALERGGYPGVITYLQTGNLLVPTRASARAVVADIDRVLTTELGIQTRPTARTARQLAAVVASNPFATPGVDSRELAVGYCSAKPTVGNVKSLAARDFGVDEWHVHGTEVYLRFPNGMGRSKLAIALEKTLGVPLTVRNWNVTTALLALAAGTAP